MGKPPVVRRTDAPQESTAHPVDRHVGAKIRLRRRELGVSQERLGQAIGVSFQQVQKYERGANRVSASMLVAIARALDAAPSYFVDDAPGSSAALGASASDDWAASRDIIADVPGAVEALVCLQAMSREVRGPMIRVMQAAARRLPDQAPPPDRLKAA